MREITYLLLLVQSGCVFSCGPHRYFEWKGFGAGEFLQGSTVDKRHRQLSVAVKKNQVGILVKK